MKLNIKRPFQVIIKAALVSTFFLNSEVLHAAEEIIVHEWGTFTSLQDASGNSISRINSDDEPVPDFVYDISRGALRNRTADATSPAALSFGSVQSKGMVRVHPHVTMRLETPVIYFYPPSGADAPITLDVDVQFRGGRITEFYPDAASDSPQASFASISPATLGHLSWKGLRVGGGWEGPKTDHRVWTAPREVKAASVMTPKGEAEKYLFYRGVANLEAPIRVVQHGDGMFHIGQNLDPSFPIYGDLSLKKFWLVDVREGGEVAFWERNKKYALGHRDFPSHDPVEKLVFADASYSIDNLSRLRKAMHTALVEDGLFADEAAAMLNTWDASYFESPGLRLFFLVPRAWTDYYLPLSISAPAKVTRVMMGRIEIVSPEQSKLLKNISASSTAQIEHYQALGRFREALLLNEQCRAPSAALNKFISDNNLQGYIVPENM